MSGTLAPCFIGLGAAGGGDDEDATGAADSVAGAASALVVTVATPSVSREYKAPPTVI